MATHQEPLLNTQSIIRNKQKPLKKQSQDTSIFWYYHFSLIVAVIKPPMTSHLTLSKSQNPDNGLKTQHNLDTISSPASSPINSPALTMLQPHCPSLLLFPNRIGLYLSQGFALGLSLRFFPEILSWHIPHHCWVFL